MGRTGYQESGMPVSGVMDRRSAALANILVGNSEDEAVLEITLMGPVMEFDEDSVIAVTGGNLLPKVNGKDFPMYQAVPVHRGDCLSFGGPAAGSRAYVAFAGGLDIPVVLGSKSTDLKSKIGGLDGRKIGGGDSIGFARPGISPSNMKRRKTEPEDFSAEEKIIRVVMGPQDDCFTEKGIDTFLTSVYTFTNESDRMGCRLQGMEIEHKNGGDIITDGIVFGAVQIPSHGQPIIMMADHQTTGGYTKIAAVISVDLPLVAQARPGQRVKFRRISIEEAQELYVEEKRRMKELKEEFDRAPDSCEDPEAVILSVLGCEAGKYQNPAGRYRAVIDGKEYILDLREEHEDI